MCSNKFIAQLHLLGIRARKGTIKGGEVTCAVFVYVHTERRAGRRRFCNEIKPTRWRVELEIHAEYLRRLCGGILGCGPWCGLEGMELTYTRRASVEWSASSRQPSNL